MRSLYVALTNSPNRKPPRKPLPSHAGDRTTELISSLQGDSTHFFLNRDFCVKKYRFDFVCVFVTILLPVTSGTCLTLFGCYRECSPVWNISGTAFLQAAWGTAIDSHSARATYGM